MHRLFQGIITSLSSQKALRYASARYGHSLKTIGFVNQDGFCGGGGDFYKSPRIFETFKIDKDDLGPFILKSGNPTNRFHPR